MFLSRIKSLVDNYNTVCRFCLQSNPQNLSSLFEKMAGKNNVVTINTTVRNVLTMLGIQIAQNDVYPNMICSSCRDLLYSVQNFRETVKETTQLLDQARLLQEFPNVKFDDEPPQEETLKEHTEFEEPTTLDVAYEVMVASNEEAAEGTVGADEIQIEMKVEKIEPDVSAEYTETEWVEYEEFEQSDHLQTDESDDIYVDEEYIQDVLSDEDKVTSDVEVTPSTPTEVIREDTVLEEEEKMEEQANPSSKKNCPICGITSTAMAVHIRTHTKIRPFTCETCEKKFYTNAKLRIHIETVHKGERRFACNVCGKAFVLRKTLNTHKMSHLAEKAFVCSICSKGFLFRWALTKHERVHTGERPYVCTLDGCGKKFATSSNLSQHQKTNAHWKNPRQDKCRDCGKSFQNKYALRAHQKSHQRSKILEKTE